MPERVYCPRCAKPAVRGDSETEEIWRCPNQHGIVYKAVLVESPQGELAIGPGTPAPQLAAENEPENEPEQDEEEEDGKEDAEPEARARAPAAQRRPPAKKSYAPKKK